MNNVALSSESIALIIFGVVVAGLILLGVYASRIDREERNTNIDTMNRKFIKDTIESINDVLSDHPSLPRSTRVEGSSNDGKGRVFNETAEYSFKITPPTKQVYNRTAGMMVDEPTTYAVLAVKGTIRDYDITVSGAGKRLVYSSRSHQILEV